MTGRVKKTAPRVAPERPPIQRQRKRVRHRFDAEAYRRRNVVERCVGWLMECRAVATRFDKLAVSYLATVILTMIQR
jgi:transposase